MNDEKTTAEAVAEEAVALTPFTRAHPEVLRWLGFASQAQHVLCVVRKSRRTLNHRIRFFVPGPTGEGSYACYPLKLDGDTQYTDALKFEKDGYFRGPQNIPADALLWNIGRLCGVSLEGLVLIQI